MNTAANPLNALNFSGGPGVLPTHVLEQVQESIRQAVACRMDRPAGGSPAAG